MLIGICQRVGLSLSDVVEEGLVEFKLRFIEESTVYVKLLELYGLLLLVVEGLDEFFGSVSSSESPKKNVFFHCKILS